MLLVGDIGGTNARLALVDAGDPRATTAEARLPSQRYRSLEDVVRDFLSSRLPVSIERAVFAVAGPVLGGRAQLTNLAWDLDEKHLADTLGISSVRLLNDLLAIAYAVPHLTTTSLHTLQTGTPQPGGAIAVVAPGTGLGQAYLVWDGVRYRASASEGGHVDFAPLDELQRELLAWLAPRFEHVSTERVCSGRGIPNLYEFLRDARRLPEDEWLTAQLRDAEDPVPVIVDAALDGNCDSALCSATLELFAAILAAHAGNVAMATLATGGLFLGGGLPRRMLNLLDRPDFIARFCRKGRMAPLLETIPVHVITARHVALLGAVQAALAEAG